MVNKNVINRVLVALVTATTLFSSQFSLTALAAIVENTTSINGTVSPIGQLDVTVPIGGISFAIDSNGDITGQGMVIKSDTVMPLDIKVLEVTGKSAGDTTNGLGATTVDAPTLVPSSKYTYDQWDNLGITDTASYIAIALKQVDVNDDKTAGTELTAATVDDNKVEFPVELGNLKINNNLSHIMSASEESQYCAVNIETNRSYTNYGKAWSGDTNTVIRYDVTLEFSY